MDLTGRVLIVTGGARGIGRAIVRGAVERGASVVFCGRSIGEEARQVEAEANLLRSGSVRAVQADVARESDVDRLFATALDTYGNVDVVINNAAVSRENLLVSMPVEDWDGVVATNLTGAMLVARRALRGFVSRGAGGAVVSIGTLSQNGAPGNTSYAASKGGLAGLTRAIARAYGAQGVRAHLVVTGYVETELSAELPDVAKRALIDACPLRRSARPEEIAAAVLFLSSDRAAGLNGGMLFASGGLLEVPL